jgi:hypothetical protein
MQIVNVKALGGARAARQAGVVYCGRGSPLGNPFRSGKDGSRAKVLARFRVWLWRQLTSGNAEVQAALEGLGEGSVLGCHCAPQACHCEVVRRAWAWWARQGRARHGSQAAVGDAAGMLPH